MKAFISQICRLFTFVVLSGIDPLCDSTLPLISIFLFTHSTFFEEVILVTICFLEERSVSFTFTS